MTLPDAAAVATLPSAVRATIGGRRRASIQARRRRSGSGSARGDGVDADPPLAELVGHAPREHREPACHAGVPRIAGDPGTSRQLARLPAMAAVRSSGLPPLHLIAHCDSDGVRYGSS